MSWADTVSAHICETYPRRIVQDPEHTSRVLTEMLISFLGLPNNELVSLANVASHMARGSPVGASLPYHRIVYLRHTAPRHKTRGYWYQGRAGRPSRRRPAPPGLPAFPGWGRPGGTLGGPAVGDSGPLHGPDRRALKQANNSSLTRLYTAFLSALPRALRHSFPSGTCNADSTLRQLRQSWFRPAESLQGSLRSPIGIDAAGKSTKHDDAANLVTQACSGHPLGSSECRI